MKQPEVKKETPPLLGAGEKQNMNAITFDSDGASNGQNGQGDFERAKEWLGHQVFIASRPDSSFWDDYPGSRFPWIEDAWFALVAALGEESAKMALLSKWSDVTKGGQP